MNITYFRKTEKSIEEAVASFKENLKKRNILLTGETKLVSGSILIHFLDKEKTENIITEDRMLLGLVPMVAMIEKKDDVVSIGLINPQLLMGTPRLEVLEGTIEEMAKEMRELVNESAGVGEPKIKNIKLYSTATCPYCKMEKDYLDKNKINFELVMVDTDREAAQNMVRKSGQTGVPQTEVIYDDGDFEIVTGFDKDRLNQLLSIK